MVVREKNCYYAIALTDFFVFLSCAENKIIKIIGYRCQETANWVASHQTVTTLIAQKPKI